MKSKKSVVARDLGESRNGGGRRSRPQIYEARLGPMAPAKSDPYGFEAKLALSPPAHMFAEGPIGRSDEIA
jgi:hypothetical protein